MKQPPSIEPAQGPGPGYDPMDLIVQELQNIESFVSFLAMNPKDLAYLNTHLSPILGSRRVISQQLDKLAEEPYSYSPAHLQILHKENEQVFIYLEDVVGMMNPWHEEKFKRAVKATEDILSQFDGDLTP